MNVDAASDRSVPPPRAARAAPLLPIAIGLVLGVALDNCAPLPTAVVLVAFPLCAATALWTRRSMVASAMIILCGVSIGALRHAVADRRLPANHIAQFLQAEPMLARVDGVIATPPSVTRSPIERDQPYDRGPRTRFILQADHIEGRAGPIAICGRVSVSVQGDAAGVGLGDHVQLFGWLGRPEGPRNPGEYDWALYNRRAGVWASLSTQHIENVHLLQHAAPSGWSGMLARLRQRLRGYLVEDAFAPDDPIGDVVVAVVMGQRSGVSRELNEAFVRTGTAHFLAASGMNVAWVALAGWLVCRLLGVRHRRAAWIVALVIAFYVLAAEPEPSILRAGIAGLIACVSLFFRGRVHSTNWLAASAIFVTMMDPMDLFRPGTQLSFAGAWGILYLTPRIESWTAPRLVGLLNRSGTARNTAEFILLPESALKKGFREEPPRLVIWRWLSRAAQLSLFGSIAAWIATTPLVCYHFSQISPFGAITTLLLSPAMFLMTLLGFLKLVVTMVIPPLGAWIGSLLAVLATCTIRTVEYLARFPDISLNGRSPSVAWTLCAYAALLAWTHAWPRAVSHVGPKFVRHLAAALTLVVIVATWLVPVRWMRHDPHALRVWMLAVGDGTGTVIELPDGQVLLYDLGTRSPINATQTAQAFFKQRGIDHINSAIISHPDFDHYGAIASLFPSVRIDRVLVSDHYRDFAPSGSPAAKFLDSMAASGATIETIAGPHRIVDEGGLVIESIWPPPRGDRPMHDENDGSMVLRMTYEGQSLLLTGDIGEGAIEGLIASVDVHADVLALPHHGSVVAGTGRLIAAVSPRFAVRSTGQRRRLTINGIEDLVRPRPYFSTADDGCILVEIRSHNLSCAARRN